MKNSQKGSATPILIVIIVLLIGVCMYLYINKNITALPTQPSQSTSTSTGSTPTSSSSSNSPISVAGMSQYTDSSFGFSFWYPSAWQVVSDDDARTSNLQGGNVVKKLKVKNTAGDAIWIQEFHSSALSITDSGGAGPRGPVTYLFNQPTHSWMVIQGDDAGTGVKPGPVAITKFTNTMGGLHMLGGTTRFNTIIIPLSSQNFVVINDGGGTNSNYLSKTVTATDPSVATPWSKDQQIQTVYSEGVLYGIFASRVGQWYIDGRNVFDFEGNIIPGADPAKFKLINTYSDGYTTDGSYATDGIRVYSGWSKEHPTLEGADPATFIPIRQMYQIPYAPSSGKYGQSFTAYSIEFSKDKSHVWYEGKLIPGADASSFVVTGDTHVQNSYGIFVLAHDSKHVYGTDDKGNFVIDNVVVKLQ